MNPIAFVQARHFTRASRKPGDVSLVVIHTAECPERVSAAENLAAWSAGPNASRASWHYAVDVDSITQSVREEDVAWHAGPVNGYSVGVEHAGYASQDAAGWADDYSLAVLERSAELVADICTRHGIPIRRIDADALARGERSGICGHVDVTRGLTGGRGHTDPGPHFPWPYFLERVRELAGIEAETQPEIDARPTVASDFDEQLVPVEVDGVRWLVSPIQYAPVSAGAALDIVRSLGCELPTPRLVDAIWRAADLKIDATLMVRRHDGTPATMDSAATHAEQATRLERLVGDRSLGRDFRLIAGAFKDFVVSDGKVGLYGWHRADGTPIQPVFCGHSLSWRDYSQGLRPVRRA